jgi:hypothetical protein
VKTPATTYARLGMAGEASDGNGRARPRNSSSTRTSRPEGPIGTAARHAVGKSCGRGSVVRAGSRVVQRQQAPQRRHRFPPHVIATPYAPPQRPAWALRRNGLHAIARTHPA